LLVLHFTFNAFVLRKLAFGTWYSTTYTDADLKMREHLRNCIACELPLNAGLQKKSFSAILGRHSGDQTRPTCRAAAPTTIDHIPDILLLPLALTEMCWRFLRKS
jgi:hypothetical protein